MLLSFPMFIFYCISTTGAPAIPRRRRHHAEAVRMNALDDYEAKADSEISFSQGKRENNTTIVNKWL